MGISISVQYPSDLDVSVLDILLRGGISIGQISMEPDLAIADDILFGPALVRSHELESKVANWPRLIIDSPIIDKAGQYKQSLWPEYICKDKDGQFFVDYLFGAATDGLLFVGGKPLNLLETLRMHKESAERKIVALVDKDARILEKLRWLVSYHNGVVRRLQELHSKPPDPFDVFDRQPFTISDSLLISQELLNTLCPQTT